MSTGCHLQAPAAFAPAQGQAVSRGFEARHRLLVSSYGDPRWPPLPTEGSLICMERLLFGVSTFRKPLSQIFGIIAAASASARAASPCTLPLQRQLPSGNLPNQPLPAPNSPSAASSPPQPSQDRRVRALLWARLRLKGTLWLLCSSLVFLEDQPGFLPASSKAGSLSRRPCVHWGSTCAQCPSRTLPLASQLGCLFGTSGLDFSPSWVSTCLPH